MGGGTGGVYVDGAVERFFSMGKYAITGLKPAAQRGRIVTGWQVNYGDALQVALNIDIRIISRQIFTVSCFERLVPSE